MYAPPNTGIRAGSDARHAAWQAEQNRLAAKRRVKLNVARMAQVAAASRKSDAIDNDKDSK